MILRLSSLFVRTLRDDPADAEVPSHRLLVRAGYIRRTAPGIYTWLPLGLRVLRKVEDVIRAEMDSIGAQELLFPALLPREPYDATGRWVEYGDGIFRLKDRKGGDYLLGPTHEEMFTLLVKDLFSSYKDLPVSLYQIQTKYRDEARPRAGLLRGREFIMKDSYSFDVDDEGLQRAYDRHRAAYLRIFDRPWAAGDTLKNVLVVLRHPDGRREPLAIGVPGDREVDAKRLEAQVEPAVVEAFTEEGFAANPALVKGYIGPGALGEEGPSKIRFLVDPRVSDGTAWVTGADQNGQHALGVIAGRDFTPDGTIEAAEVRDGDPCPVDGAPLQTARGIEIGHIFQLGRKYADALGLKVLDENGKQVTVTMGSYGIGVTRILAIIAELNNDDRGLIWPASVAPF